MAQSQLADPIVDFTVSAHSVSSGVVSSRDESSPRGTACCKAAACGPATSSCRRWRGSLLPHEAVVQALRRAQITMLADSALNRFDHLRRVAEAVMAVEVFILLTDPRLWLVIRFMCRALSPRPAF